MQKIDEGRLQTIEVMAISLHVVCVNVGHNRHHRQQIQERRIRLVGFDDDVIPAAQLGIGTGAVEPSADHEGRIQSCFRKDAGHQAGGRRLAVSASDRYALLEAHQLSQHQGPRHDGNVLLAGSHDLRVVGLHRGRCDDRVGTHHVGRSVAHIGPDAQASEPLQRRAVGQIRTRDHIAQGQQNFGDAAHARASEAYEMNVANCMFHEASSSQAATTSWVASVFRRAQACSARCSNSARRVSSSMRARPSGESWSC